MFYQLIIFRPNDTKINGGYYKSKIEARESMKEIMQEILKSDYLSPTSFIANENAFYFPDNYSCSIRECYRI